MDNYHSIFASSSKKGIRKSIDCNSRDTSPTYPNKTQQEKYSTEILVSNLPENITDVEIAELFGPLGTIYDIRIKVEEHCTNAWIIYKNEQDAKKAYQLNRRSLKGKKIQVHHVAEAVDPSKVLISDKVLSEDEVYAALTGLGRINYVARTKTNTFVYLDRTQSVAKIIDCKAFAVRSLNLYELSKAPSTFQYLTTLESLLNIHCHDNKVVVENFDSDVNYHEMKTFFSRYGKICSISNIKSKSSSKSIRINFYSKSDAQTACEALDGTLYGDRRMRAHMSNDAKLPNFEASVYIFGLQNEMTEEEVYKMYKEAGEIDFVDKTYPCGKTLISFKNSESVDLAFKISDKKLGINVQKLFPPLRFNMHAPQTVQSTAIYIGNLHTKTTVEQITEYLGQCGEIKSHIFYKHHSTSLTKIAYIHFENNAQAKKACELSNNFFQGKRLFIMMADDQRHFETWNTVSIKNIDNDTTEEDLFEIFHKYGKIFSIQKPSPTTAFVCFEDYTVVKTILPKKFDSLTVTRLQGKSPMRLYSFKFVRNAQKEMFEKDESVKTVQINNCPKNVTLEQWRTFFTGCGFITSVKEEALQYCETNITYAVFENAKEAQRACRMSLLLFQEKRLFIHLANHVPIYDYDKMLQFETTEAISEEKIYERFIQAGKITYILKGNPKCGVICFENLNSIDSAIALCLVDSSFKVKVDRLTRPLSDGESEFDDVSDEKDPKYDTFLSDVSSSSKEKAESCKNFDKREKSKSISPVPSMKKEDPFQSIINEIDDWRAKNIKFQGPIIQITNCYHNVSTGLLERFFGEVGVKPLFHKIATLKNCSTTILFVAFPKTIPTFWIAQINQSVWKGKRIFVKNAKQDTQFKRNCVLEVTNLPKQLSEEAIYDALKRYGLIKFIIKSPPSTAYVCMDPSGAERATKCELIGEHHIDVQLMSEKKNFLNTNGCLFTANIKNTSLKDDEKRKEMNNTHEKCDVTETNNSNMTPSENGTLDEFIKINETYLRSFNSTVIEIMEQCRKEFDDKNNVDEMKDSFEKINCKFTAEMDEVSEIALTEYRTKNWQLIKKECNETLKSSLSDAMDQYREQFFQQYVDNKDFIMQQNFIDTINDEIKTLEKIADEKIKRYRFDFRRLHESEQEIEEFEKAPKDSIIAKILKQVVIKVEADDAKFSDVEENQNDSVSSTVPELEGTDSIHGNYDSISSNADLNATIERIKTYDSDPNNISINSVSTESNPDLEEFALNALEAAVDVHNEKKIEPEILLSSTVSTTAVSDMNKYRAEFAKIINDDKSETVCHIKIDTTVNTTTADAMREYRKEFARLHENDEPTDMDIDDEKSNDSIKLTNDGKCQLPVITSQSEPTEMPKRDLELELLSIFHKKPEGNIPALKEAESNLPNADICEDAQDSFGTCKLDLDVFDSIEGILDEVLNASNDSDFDGKSAQQTAKMILDLEDGEEDPNETQPFGIQADFIPIESNTNAKKKDLEDYILSNVYKDLMEIRETKEKSPELSEFRRLIYGSPSKQSKIQEATQKEDGELEEGEHEDDSLDLLTDEAQKIRENISNLRNKENSRSRSRSTSRNRNRKISPIQYLSKGRPISRQKSYKRSRSRSRSNSSRSRRHRRSHSNSRKRTCRSRSNSPSRRYHRSYKPGFRNRSRSRSFDRSKRRRSRSRSRGRQGYRHTSTSRSNDRSRKHTRSRSNSRGRKIKSPIRIPSPAKESPASPENNINIPVFTRERSASLEGESLFSILRRRGSPFRDKVPIPSSKSPEACNIQNSSTSSFTSSDTPVSGWKALPLLAESPESYFPVNDLRNVLKKTPTKEKLTNKIVLENCPIEFGMNDFIYIFRPYGTIEMYTRTNPTTVVIEMRNSAQAIEACRANGFYYKNRKLRVELEPFESPKQTDKVLVLFNSRITDDMLHETFVCAGDISYVHMKSPTSAVIKFLSSKAVYFALKVKTIFGRDVVVKEYVD